MSDSSIGSLGLFTHEVHRPFQWQGGRPAALLIHGFMGTPAEMRPLAQELHAHGWTVQGLLLPGFGQQIDTLFDRRRQEWIDVTREAQLELQSQHGPVLLVGYSMGAAVALNAAAEDAPDALILLAPFWHLGNPLHHLIWRLLKLALRNPQPFRNADFSDPRFGDFLAGLLPDLELDDPQTQEALRRLRVPARFVDDFLALGKSARRSAKDVRVPSLILQGTQDEAVRPSATRRLLQDYAGPVRYEELATGHDLLQTDQAAFAQIATPVIAFANMQVERAVSHLM